MFERIWDLEKILWEIFRKFSPKKWVCVTHTPKNKTKKIFQKIK
jgi:hypothetical protein